MEFDNPKLKFVPNTLRMWNVSDVLTVCNFDCSLCGRYHRGTADKNMLFKLAKALMESKKE